MDAEHSGDGGPAFSLFYQPMREIEFFGL